MTIWFQQYHPYISNVFNKHAITNELNQNIWCAKMNWYVFRVT